MDQEWAIAKLRDFIALTTLRARYFEGVGTFDELTVDQQQIITVAQTVEKIMDRVTPGWRDHEQPDPEQQWQPRRHAAVRALSEIQNAAEVAQNLGENAPVMNADAMHPWAWDAARSLWQSRHFGEAVRAATVKLNAELQNKLDRRDTSETALFQQAFSADPPSVGAPRLRPAGDDGGKTAISVRRGIVALAEGCYAAIRNPASHDPMEEASEQIALEQLAVVSLLARWVDDSTLEKA